MNTVASKRDNNHQVSTAVSYSEIVTRINAAPLKKVNPTALMTR